MRLFRPTLILCCLLFAMAPAAAHADVDEEVVEKLKPYVTQASEAEQAAAKQAAMLAQGFWTSTKETEALEAGLTANDEDTRLSAAIAIYMVKGSRGDDALLKELRARTALYEALRDRVSLLKDDDELPILKELAQDAKAPMLRGLTRYMATHQGPIWEMLTEWAQDSKETPRRKMALEAIVAAATHPEAVAQAAVLAKHDDPRRTTDRQRARHQTPGCAPFGKPQTRRDPQDTGWVERSRHQDGRDHLVAHTQSARRCGHVPDLRRLHRRRQSSLHIA